LRNEYTHGIGVTENFQENLMFDGRTFPVDFPFTNQPIDQI
jgi:hypothetical protein